MKMTFQTTRRKQGGNNCSHPHAYRLNIAQMGAPTREQIPEWFPALQMYSGSQTNSLFIYYDFII